MFLQAKLFSCLLIGSVFLALQPGPSSGQALPSQAELRKITFDVFRSSPGGATGQPDSWRSLSYEFCIPAHEEQLAEVQSIDPMIRHFAHSRGRIGCRSDQYLCIADAHSPQWQEILYAIARLEYVERIDQFFGE